MKTLSLAGLMLLLARGAALASDPRSALEHAMAATKTPAMTVLIIRASVAEPEVVRGVKRVDRPDPVHPGERWHLGSDTKAMTAMLVARLVEQGRLSWTATLDRMLPELATTMRPEYRTVTLADLLSHRSGLTENVANAERVVAKYFADPRPLAAQRLEYIGVALGEAPLAPPRTKFSYSNTGFILAGVIAERAAGRSYEALMQSMVFGPLGMSSARLSQASGDEPMGHVDGRVEVQADENPDMFNPAGGARMALADWAKFCIDELNGPKGGGKLLKPDTYRFIQSAQGEDGGRGWAFGWGVAPVVLGRAGPALTHSGSDGNWYAVVALLPASGNGLLVASNSAESMGGDKAVGIAARELMTDLAPPKPADPAPPARTGK